MSERLHLRSDVHAVAIDDDLVFLDASADRYLFLPGGREPVGPRADGDLHVNDDAAQLMLSSGLACPGPSPAARRSVPDLPTQGLAAERVDAHLRAIDLWRLIAAVVDAFRFYRGRDFGQIVGFVRDPPRSGAAASNRTEAPLLAARFDAAAVWLPLGGKCLIRSFVLLRFLQRSGCDAQWVLGVRTSPFAAHCWLQLGEVVLDDLPERLAPYHPIAVF